MRRYALVLGLAAVMAGATAVPAAAQTISPGNYSWGQVDPKKTQRDAEFELKAGAVPLIGDPTVISGDAAQFNVLAGFCDGSLNPGQSCIFRVRLVTTGPPTGAKSAVVGVPGGPTATVSATFPGGSSSKGKKCKKKGKKGAAAAKKKKCGKKKGKK